MQFTYKARQGPQKILEGVIDADNLDSAISKILDKGLTPIDVKIKGEVGKTKKAKLPIKSIVEAAKTSPWSF